MPWLGGQKLRPKMAALRVSLRVQSKHGWFGGTLNELTMEDAQAIAPYRSRCITSLRLPMVLVCSTMAILGGGLEGTVGRYLGGAARAQSIAEEVSPVNYPPGLCYQGQRDISGSWVNDGTGQLVPLPSLCEVAIQHRENTRIPPEDTEFWHAFLTAASPEALEFANTAGVESVTTYGQTICPSLTELGTMNELRMLQVQGGLPASFDAAINVAAIHTYCPGKTRSIGR